MASIVANDEPINEAFVHALCNMYTVNIVLFAQGRIGPNRYIKMMLYKPGYDEVQHEIWIRELKSVLAGSTPVYCIYHDHEGAGHFSAMRVFEPKTPDGVDLTSPPARRFSPRK